MFLYKQRVIAERKKGTAWVKQHLLSVDYILSKKASRIGDVRVLCVSLQKNTKQKEFTYLIIVNEKKVAFFLSSLETASLILWRTIHKTGWLLYNSVCTVYNTLAHTRARTQCLMCHLKLFNNESTP